MFYYFAAEMDFFFNDDVLSLNLFIYGTFIIPKKVMADRAKIITESLLAVIFVAGGSGTNQRLF